MCARWRHSPATRTCAPSAATATTDQTSPARSPALSLQNELRTADHLLAGSLAGIAAGLSGLKVAGRGGNPGLGGRSDRETPEAGMMRDQSSVEAAPATLRAEESRPGATSAPRETLKNSATPISDQGKSIAWPFLQLRFRLFSVCP